MSLWSTLPPDEQVLTEPAAEADLALGLAVLALLWQLIAMLVNDPAPASS